MTVSSWINAAARALTAAACPDCELDARLLAAGVLRLSPVALRFSYQKELSEAQEALLNERLVRRIGGEPLQYIENAAYFMGLCFYVDERVLIPRQDTETLAEEALAKMRGLKAPKVLDMCCGSGALAISIARYRPDADVTGADISKGAIEVSEKNAKLLKVRADFIESDLFSSLDGERYDVIVCNPPYLTRADMGELQTEVQREPRLALYGGENGLDFYVRLSQGLSSHLRPGGYALFEVGAGQAGDVQAIMNAASPREGGIIKDLCGIDRVVWVRSA